MSMTMSNREHMRFNMIEQQIRPWNVLNQRVLNVFDVVNRDDFVVDEHKLLAFSEVRLPLGGKDQMLTPAIEGRILQEVDIQAEDNILIVGTGSGFLAALAANLGQTVTAIDINNDYTQKAKANAERVGLTTIDFVTADVKDFVIENNRYDVIILTGSVSEVPQKFIDGLTATGRLFAFVGQHGETVTSGTVFQNQLGEIRTNPVFEIELERLHGFEDQPKFVF